MIKNGMKNFMVHYISCQRLLFKFMIVSVFLVFSLLAVNPAFVAAEDVDIKVNLNESKIVTVNKPKRIAIGNPDIVDVVNASDDMVILSPKIRGTTNLMIWDNAGIHSYRVRVVGGDMQEVKLRVDEILEQLNLTNVQAKISEDDDRIFLFGEVRGQQDKDLLNAALGPLRQKVTNLIKIREEDMVEIEAQLVELNKDGTKSLGFSWPGSLTFTEQGSPGTQPQGTKMSTLFKVLNYSRDQFNFTLDALIQENKARILSKPRLACLSGKEATLLVGGEKPIFTTEVVSATSGTGVAGTSVSYKEYGIKLKIKPVVLENNMINVTLQLSISEPGAVESIGGVNTTAKAYPFTKRDITTELYLNDGQTLGIGGLIKQKLDDEVRTTPFLGEIPIVGIMFKKRVSRSGGGFGEKGDTELFIILTPKIVSGKKETAANPPALSSVSEPKAAPVKKEDKPINKVVSSQNISDEEKKEVMENAVYSEKPISQILSQPKSVAADKGEIVKSEVKAVTKKDETSLVKPAVSDTQNKKFIKDDATAADLSGKVEAVPDIEKKGVMEKAVYSDKPISKVSSPPKSDKPVSVSVSESQVQAKQVKSKEQPNVLAAKSAGTVSQLISPAISVAEASDTGASKEKSVSTKKRETAIVESVSSAQSQETTSVTKKEEKKISLPVTEQAVPDSVKKKDMTKDVYSGNASTVSLSEEAEEMSDAKKKEIMEKTIYSEKPIAQILSQPKSATTVKESAAKSVVTAQKEETIITQKPGNAQGVSSGNEEKVETSSSVVSNASPDSVVEYANSVRKTILDKLSYPSLAKQRGLQGRVKLRLHISSLGELIEVFVKESSTYEILDYNTLSVAKNIIKYPPFPSSIVLDDLWLEIPIDYKLN